VARVAGVLASGIVCREVTAGLLDQVFSAEAVIESERDPRSAASLHRMKAAVRAFFAWAVEAGVVEDNPARSIRMHRLPRKLPVFLTTAEKKRLLKELKGRTDFSALRDRAMIEVLLGTGIRLGELAALDMDDIDLDAKHLRVRAKGNVPQVKFIKTDLRTLLRRYLAERRRHGVSSHTGLIKSGRLFSECVKEVNENFRLNCI
jgi:integrase/recombinase XerC